MKKYTVRTLKKKLNFETQIRNLNTSKIKKKTLRLKKLKKSIISKTKIQTFKIKNQSGCKISKKIIINKTKSQISKKNKSTKNELETKKSKISKIKN